MRRSLGCMAVQRRTAGWAGDSLLGKRIRGTRLPVLHKLVRQCSWGMALLKHTRQSCEHVQRTAILLASQVLDRPPGRQLTVDSCPARGMALLGHERYLLLATFCACRTSWTYAPGWTCTPCFLQLWVLALTGTSLGPTF